MTKNDHKWPKMTSNGPNNTIHVNNPKSHVSRVTIFYEIRGLQWILNVFSMLEPVLWVVFGLDTIFNVISTLEPVFYFISTLEHVFYFISTLEPVFYFISTLEPDFCAHSTKSFQSILDSWSFAHLLKFLISQQCITQHNQSSRSMFWLEAFPFL